tara:strand:- start:55969 stop:56166 length:198 start_codon:yes stop_codon:yes gene_type:complete
VKVRELIESLSALDPDSEVIHFRPEYYISKLDRKGYYQDSKYIVTEASQSKHEVELKSESINYGQ